MKKISIIIFVLTVLASCTEKPVEDVKANPFDQNHPPPPPSMDMINQVRANNPSAEETIKAIEQSGRINGVSESDISKAVIYYKKELQKECLPCYKELIANESKKK